MKDEELMELMEVIREIPQPHWDLLCFVRSMSGEDFSRLQALATRAGSHIVNRYQYRPEYIESDRDNPDPKQEASPKQEESLATPQELQLDQLRKFL